MKNILFSILLVNLLSACGNSAAPETAASKTETPEGATPETVVLTREQLQSAGIALGLPEQRNIAEMLRVNGAVAVLPEDKATVTAKIAGRIEQFFIHEGQSVKKGQPLVSIASNALFDLQQAYLHAGADLIFLEKELERQKTLSTQNVGAAKYYEEAQAKYARSKGDLQTAAAKLRYLGIDLENLRNPDQLKLAETVVVRAPIGGNVTEIPVNLGAGVGEGTLLCSIVGLDDLHAHIEVFAKDMSLVREGLAVTVHFPNTGFPPVSSKIEYLSRDLNPESKTYSLHVHLPAPRGNSYLPGMPVMADIQTQSGRPGLALPEAAVLHDGTESYCFAALNPGQTQIEFQKIVFEPTASGGGWVGVPAGLLDGKTVVLRGANLVDGALRKGEMQE